MTILVESPRVNILGVSIHNLTRVEALAYIKSMIATRSPHLVSTPNVDYIVQSQQDSLLRQILNTSDLTVADGMGVVYASRLLGTPLKTNVGGRLLVPEMCFLAAQCNYRVYLLGARPGIALSAADRLRQCFPELQISGVQHGYFSPEEERNIIASVRKTHSDMLILAMGTPKQEKWMYKYKNALEVPVTIGVGSTLDRVSGHVAIPPQWMTGVGLEWFYRLLQEPNRLGRRYLINDPVFFWQVLQQRLNMEKQSKLTEE